MNEERKRRRRKEDELKMQSRNADYGDEDVGVAWGLFSETH